MRSLLLVFAAFSAVPLLAADPTPAPTAAPEAEKTPSDPSAAAWGDVLRHMQPSAPFKSKEERNAFLNEAIVVLGTFIRDYPASPHAVEARFNRVQLQLIALPPGKNTLAEVDPVLTELRALAGEAATSPGEKQRASAMLLQVTATFGSSAEVDTELTAYESAHPDQPAPPMLLGLLATKLAEANPEKAKKFQAQADELQAKQAEEKAKADEAMQLLVNKPLDVKFTALGGAEIDLQKMNGKVVLLDFWATWCGPCMQELPNVLAVYEKYHDKGFEIVGISFDESKDALVKTVAAKEMTWPQYFDGKGWGNELGKRFGITSIPRMWLVNKEGLLVDLNGREDLEKKVADLLGK